VRQAEEEGEARRAALDAQLAKALEQVAAMEAGYQLLPPPPPPSRTNWTRLVPPSVLTGHVLKALEARSSRQPRRLRARARRSCGGSRRRRSGCCKRCARRWRTRAPSFLGDSAPAGGAAPAAGGRAGQRAWPHASESRPAPSSAVVWPRMENKCAHCSPISRTIAGSSSLARQPAPRRGWSAVVNTRARRWKHGALQILTFPMYEHDDARAVR
jgi:hypothetical protein